MRVLLGASPQSITRSATGLHMQLFARRADGAAITDQQVADFFLDALAVVAVDHPHATAAWGTSWPRSAFARTCVSTRPASRCWSDSC